MTTARTRVTTKLGTNKLLMIRVTAPAMVKRVKEKEPSGANAKLLFGDFPPPFRLRG